MALAERLSLCTRTAAIALLACFSVACAATVNTRGALLEAERASLATPAPERFDVRFETSQGPIVVAVHRAWAPAGADRFYYLVRNGFFDGERFFRVREGFIAQFGLNGDPAVIAAWKHRNMPDDPVRVSNIRGTLAYAMTGPNTRTTQIYINLSNNQKLDSQGFAPFAQVTSGMDAVDHIYAGYGENAGGGVRAGKQGLIEAGGNAYLTREFPKLDYIIRAFVIKP